MSDTIRFTLDGREAVAEPGQTIWDVAHGQGLKIPHLCHRPEPGYRPDGNCRACMVEVEGERNLVASCIREPQEGMVVTTDSGRAAQARKMVVEMLMADQPGRDVSHDRSSHFWDMADVQGVTESRFPAMKAERIPLLDDSHVAMRVNLDACIQCNLCVRACREVQVNDVIGMANRGHDALPVFDFDDPMGAVHLRRLRRMRAGLPDRGADAGERGRRASGRRPRRLRQRGKERLPVLRRRLPGLGQGQGRQGEVRRGHQRPRQRGPPLRQGPLRLRLHPPRPPPDEAADPPGRRAGQGA